MEEHEDTVAPLADLDFLGRLPEDLHHTKGRVGADRQDPKKVIGLSREAHAALHAHTAERTTDTLFDSWG